MRRRNLLRLASAATLLAAPRVARSRPERTLKFVPLINLALLDPVFSGNRATHNHAYLVFDTLYGLDETLTARPQMVEGHTVEEDGTTWSLRLRDPETLYDFHQPASEEEANRWLARFIRPIISASIAASATVGSTTGWGICRRRACGRCARGSGSACLHASRNVAPSTSTAG
jgi:hypothetical protein